MFGCYTEDAGRATFWISLGWIERNKVAQKTNAARLLDQMGIRYELREYEVDPNDLAAETVAAKIGLPPEQVFKTLVARGGRSKDRSKDRNGISMAVIPGDQELNLKSLAAAAGERKIQLVPVKELQSLTQIGRASG